MSEFSKNPRLDTMEKAFLKDPLLLQINSANKTAGTHLIFSFLAINGNKSVCLKPYYSCYQTGFNNYY